MTNTTSIEAESAPRPAPESDAEPQPDVAGDSKLATRLIDGAVAFICFGVATAWTFNPFRTPYSGRTFSGFFEVQAESFLEGKLALEKGALGIEAFVRDGADYMYFGPLLAIGRLPFVAVGVFEAQLTAVSLLLGTLLFYVQAIKMLDIMVALVHPDADRQHRWLRLGWRASVATGTVVLTLLAIPWVYHEAHLWSAALFLTLLNQLLQFEEMPSRRIWVLGAVLIAVALNRPTTAYAGLIGAAALIVIVLVRSSAARSHVVQLSLWMAAALVAAVGVNMLKFRRPFGIPMEAQVYSTVDANRAEMLRVNDGNYFRLEFIPSNVWAYFKPNGVDVSSNFPFVAPPQSVPHVFGDYFYDATYRTASVTATNPLLFLASLLGTFVLVAKLRGATRWRLVAPVAAGILAAGGVAGWGYMATRYLTDFLPGMLLLSAIGLAWLVRTVDAHPGLLSSQVRRVGAAVGVALVAWSIVANTAISIGYNFSAGDQAAGIDRLLAVQDATSALIGSSPAERTERVETLRFDRDDPVPSGTIAIIGDCEGLYYSNGEPVDTWRIVEYGQSDWRSTFTMTPTAALTEGTTFSLVDIVASDELGAYEFDLQYRVDDIDTDAEIIEYSLIMLDNFGSITVDELEMPSVGATDFSVTFERYLRNFFVEQDGDNILYGHFDMDALYDAANPRATFIEPGDALGMQLVPTAAATPWCDRLSSALDSPTS